MQPFTIHTGLAAAMLQDNLNTDLIIPKQFLKTIHRRGLGRHLFHDLRYREDGSEDPGFVLNREPGRSASILLAGANFGCGSSREHAPWALEDYGFRAIIAPSYADIFFNNCFKNGVLPIVLAAEVVDHLFRETLATEGYRLTVDLAAQTVTTPAGEVIAFEVDGERKHRLLNGLDDIGLTLQFTDEIKAYEERRRVEAAWLFQ